ncbi:MAG: hypothetical protein HRU38_10845 [Saccharospirillaceae bacterium]|nr:hypothetical protein [Saccharospirillaceae bacterium]
MKIIPAHSIEAAEMADILLEEWISMGFPLNVKLSSGMSDTSPTLVQVKDILSRSFGWESWDEMNTYITKPHEPVYIDDDNQLLIDVAQKLAEEIGYDYAHGRVISMLQNAGTGYSPKYRRELASLATPWGIIEDSSDIAEGIRSVSTASHGGYVLSEQ